MCIKKNKLPKKVKCKLCNKFEMLIIQNKNELKNKPRYDFSKVKKRK